MERKTAIYVRNRKSENQEDRLASTDTQKKIIEEYARKNELLDNMNIKYNSTDKIERHNSSLIAMMERIMNRDDVDCIMVKDMERLDLDSYKNNQFDIMDMLKQKGIQIIEIANSTKNYH
ncbi:hypothetical protein AT55_01560 [Streptococcus equi subsp. zooepidemicus Sz4is]|uniref:Resolvase/invertase-type recombinase catalytic domain-containing protein n=2 Tax=Streptococcus equi TaxID=1336 RepID=A0AAW3GJB1_STRSZ|nr:hypothetical protein AT55_01560 [Streptococcus equi subsp. zooepidemicus Sz4is]